MCPKYTRKLRVTVSASATSGGFFVLYILVGATGTGLAATSTALRATCSLFFAASGALSR